jgi:DNA-binding protein HU-beta
MNRNDLIEEVSKVVKTKKNAESTIKIVFKTITEALKSGDSVSLPGFGTFSVSNRKARAGRNPRTGEAISIPARKVAKFSPGKGLKDAVA